MKSRRKPRASVLAWIASAGLLAPAPFLLHARETAYLVKDINRATHNSGSNPGQYEVVNGRVIFVTQRYPQSLLATTGQTGNVVTLAEQINDVGPLVGGRKYYTTFTSNPDPPYSYAMTLHASDGTVQGTTAVKTVQNQSLSIPYNATIGSRCLFTIETFDGNTGQSSRELWSVGGTATAKLFDFAPNSYGPNVVGKSGGRLVLVSNNSQGLQQFWATDGTPAGTEALGIEDVPFQWSYAFGDRLLINALQPDGSGEQLWVTDGTAAGTNLLMTSRPGNIILVTYQDPVDTSGRLYLITGAYGVADDELWLTDGTPAGTIRLMGTAQSDPTMPAEQLAINVRQADGQTFFVSYAEDPFAASLWRTDGTPAGTTRLKTGPYFSLLDSMSNGSSLILRAKDSDAGMELWTSDGTAAGTLPLADLYPGADETDPQNPVPHSSSPRNFVRLGGEVYFLADTAENVRQIWTSDGTEAGTIPVTANLPPLNWGSSLDYLIEGDTALFTASDQTELWQFAPGSQNTLTRLAATGEGGIIMYLYETPDSPMGSSIHHLGGKLLFKACDPDHDWQVWASDGTADGAVPLETPPVQAGTCGYNVPQFLADINGTLFYANSDSSRGQELHKTNGTPSGSSIVKDIDPGSAPGLGGYQLEFVAYNGQLIFTGSAPDSGPEPWVSDGTASGTRIIRDVLRGNDSMSYSLNAAALGERVVFSADDGIHYTEPWVSDGTSNGTKLLANLVSEDGVSGSYLDWDCGSSPQGFTALGDLVLFGARYLSGSCDSYYGSAPGVYKTDGGASGTTLVKLTFQPGEGYYNFFPSFLARIGNALLMSAWDPVHGRELWQTSGSSSGTFMVADLDPSSTDYGYGYTYPNSGEPGFMVQWRNDLYFQATTKTEGRELWKMNVQSRVPSLVKDLRPGFEDYGYPDPLPKSSDPGGFTALGNALYFSATDDESGSRRGLWKTDGTEAGTVLVKDFCGEGEYCGVGQIVRLGNKLIFSATEPASGSELWISDGTTAGTRLLKDLWPGVTQDPYGSYPNSSYPSNLVVLDDWVLFTAATEQRGWGELWRTNGTASGTVLVKDINPGPAPAYASGLKLVGDRVYLAATSADTGRELWRTNGTTQGTDLVQDINPGPAGSDPNSLIRAGDRLFFTATDARPFDTGHGRELWALRLEKDERVRDRGDHRDRSGRH